MKAKKIVAIVSLAAILVVGLNAVLFANTLPRTYGGGVDVDALYIEATDATPGSVTAESALAEAEKTLDVADDMVARNLDETMAANNVAAIVFDFRGYDTIGESLILLTAIAGTYVILSRSHKKKKEDEE
ncbi:MAG: hypothetical protein IJ299_02040 [Oscillospiraceae bacterium]|nr:hypothetical protein [Oscillospiraceae bacterium]